MIPDIVNGWVTMLMPKIFIYYYPEENVFRTNDGRIITNLYPLVTANQIFLFKRMKKSVEFVAPAVGVVVRLLYPVGGRSDEQPSSTTNILL